MSIIPGINIRVSYCANHKTVFNVFKVTPMMEDCMEYLERRARNEPSFKYEIIIVNDGSKDSTTDVAMGYVRRFNCDNIRLLNLEKNRGKGGAVRLVSVLHHEVWFVLYSGF